MTLPRQPPAPRLSLDDALDWLCRIGWKAVRWEGVAARAVRSTQVGPWTRSGKCNHGNSLLAICRMGRSIGLLGWVNLRERRRDAVHSPRVRRGDYRRRSPRGGARAGRSPRDSFVPHAGLGCGAGVVRRWPDLCGVYLFDTAITGAGFRGFRDHRELRQITLLGPNVNDAGVRAVSPLPHVSRLCRSAPRIVATDASTAPW